MVFTARIKHCKAILGQYILYFIQATSPHTLYYPMLSTMQILTSGLFFTSMTILYTIYLAFLPLHVQLSNKAVRNKVVGNNAVCNKAVLLYYHYTLWSDKTLKLATVAGNVGMCGLEFCAKSLQKVIFLAPFTPVAFTAHNSTS